ncbi:hypothetical protein AALP_AA1G208400 [Arabis alpina]|uniref:Importin subunit beta-1/Transportin-1-like TPR repeats domain-containing protein n=1 Tax=Arabis alpina TaxID=50452 RepID=A0A087HPJ4_ARAAL|nr:hypothetical protein AALP_AA1G208400 [Arabis alpina]
MTKSFYLNFKHNTPTAISCFNFIIRFLYESALFQEVKIRHATFQCLSSIASIHFEVLKPHIHYLFDLTSDVVKGDVGSVALQAIEFWSSICATEIEHPEVVNPQPDWPGPLLGFIELALPHFVPTLLERMLKPQDDQDHVSNISMAAGTCLGLVSQKVGVAIVPFVTSFVDAKISDPHWRSREAASFAFGSVLDVPTFVKLAVLDFLLNATKDEKNKDTTASRIFDFLHSPASGSPGNLPRFVDVLLQAINNDVPNVAEKICGALYSLAQGYEDVGASSSLLTQYPGEIIQHLLAAAEHKDEQVSKLRAGAAYDLLNVVVRCSNVADASNIIAHLLSEIIQEIDKTMDIPIILMDGREKQAKLHASLCVLLQVLIQKLNGTYHQ